MTQYFKPALFKFMRELAENNDRTWFKANQERFEADVREPALDFIGDMADPLLLPPHAATSRVFRIPTAAARRWVSRDVYSRKGEKVMS